MLCIRCQRDYDGSSYPHWQKHCWTCKAIVDAQEESSKLSVENEKLRKNQIPSGGGHWPITDPKSEAEFENEELRSELATLRAKLQVAEKAALVNGWNQQKEVARTVATEKERDALATTNAELTVKVGQAVKYADALKEANASLSRGHIHVLSVNAELTAHCEQLRGELEEAEHYFDSLDSGSMEDSDADEYGNHIEAIRDVLRATPATSLVAIERRDAVKALREVTTHFRTPARIDTTTFWTVISHLDDEAERLEAEGGK